MMKKFIFTLLFGIISVLGFSQRIYVVDTRQAADKIVYITNNYYNAQLKVYVTYNPYETKKDWNYGVWFFTTNRSECDYKVFFTTDKYDPKAEKIVYVKSKFSAGTVK